MISEFATLLDKIRQLADATHSLRSENAALRDKLAAASADNLALAARMGQAHERLAALLEAMPEAAADAQEAA